MPSVRVSLQALRKQREERFELLSDIANELLNSGQLGTKAECEVYLDDVALFCAVDAYFLLNEAYKKERIAERHATKPPKIAAISAAVCADFKPIRVIDPKRKLNHPYSINANGLLSLLWAATVFDQDISKLPEHKWNGDSVARYFRMLRRVELRSLHAFKVDIERGEVRPHYDIILDHDTDWNRSPMSDMPMIDQFLLVFELMWEGGGSFEE